MWVWRKRGRGTESAGNCKRERERARMSMEKWEGGGDVQCGETVERCRDNTNRDETEKERHESTHWKRERDTPNPHEKTRETKNSEDETDSVRRRDWNRKEYKFWKWF